MNRRRSDAIVAVIIWTASSIVRKSQSVSFTDIATEESYLDEFCYGRAIAVWVNCTAGGKDSGRRLTFIIDLAVAVDIRLTYHLINFRIGELLACMRGRGEESAPSPSVVLQTPPAARDVLHAPRLVMT